MVSVTEILDHFIEPELLAWYKRIGFKKAEEISQEALRIGTIVDVMIKESVRHHSSYNPPYPTTELGIWNCWKAWRLFNEDHPDFPPTVTGIQTELTDGELIGHPDLEITEEHRWGIVDIKTSKAIQPKHWLQVAAYWWLKGKQPPVKSPFTSFVGILRLDKQTDQYEYREINDIETLQAEVEVFQAYLTCYQHGQRIRETLRRQLEEEVLDGSHT